MQKSRQRPYLASYCLVRRGTDILMQRRYNTGYLDGFWALPSGFVGFRESAVHAASRELLEETSLVVKPEHWKFVCVMHRQTTFPIIDLFFETERFSGEHKICEADKCDGLAFFSANNLPQPLADYIGMAISCLQGNAFGHGAYFEEGWL